MIKRMIEFYFFDNQNITSSINIKINSDIDSHSSSSSQFISLQIFNLILRFSLYIISLLIILLIKIIDIIYDSNFKITSTIHHILIFSMSSMRHRHPLTNIEKKKIIIFNKNNSYTKVSEKLHISQ